MPITRQAQLLALFIAAAVAMPALAQEPTAPAPNHPLAPISPEKPATPPVRHSGRPKSAAEGTERPKLLGQFGEWGAYTASPGGKKVCFALAKPTSSETIPPNRPRNPPYLFVSSRPADKVADEVSIIIGYPFRPNSDATADIGSTSFALATQHDGAWIKNGSEQAHMVDAMRAGQSVVVKGVSGHGTKTSDTFSLKGFSQALDRIDQDCK
jgi:hypothetical protein